MRLGFASALVLCAACAPPPARSPLSDHLAASDTPGIEAATRTCLADEGWRVDPIGELIAGANVVTAAKKNEQTQVYIQPHDVVPRITGGPDDSDEFWPCLSKELEAAKKAPHPAEAE